MHKLVSGAVWASASVPGALYNIQWQGSRQAGGGVARHRPQDDIASLKMTSLARLISHVSSIL